MVAKLKTSDFQLICIIYSGTTLLEFDHLATSLMSSTQHAN